MKHPVRLERHSGVAVISIENPPVNALGHAVRAGILAALNAAVSDDAVKAIVIAARGRTFPAGADITEFGTGFEEPGLPELCDLVEAASKPVIAALHGTVLGGGLELAIACHYRLAEKSTRLGFPEIKLGLLPGAGGTQRAPRLIGAGPAMDLMLSGTQVSAEDALELGLVDQLNSGTDLREAAIAFAEGKVAKGPYPTSELRGHLHDGVGFMAEVKMRREKSRGSLAERKIFDCVEAASLLPFETGRAMEGRAFVECMNSRASKGLRRAFFAERLAGKFPDEGEARSIETVAIVGGGDGVEIAVACMNAGLSVTIVEEGEEGINATLDRIGPLYEGSVQRGRMSETAASKALSRMNLTTKIEEIAPADLIVETVGEEFDLKSAVLELIAIHAKSDAVIATQTSLFDVSALGEASGRGSDVVGVHFFDPAHASRIVEITPSNASSADAVLALRDLAKRLGKIPVRVAGGAGLIGDRLGARMQQVADDLLIQGATPDQVDAEMIGFGFAVGVFENQDRIGLDRVAEPRAAVDLPKTASGALFDKLCLSGAFGLKSGHGYYTYDASGQPQGINPILSELIQNIQKEQSIAPQSLTSRDILNPLLMSLVNEAALLIEEERINHPSDIDMVMVHQHGYPRDRGGPLMDADETSPFEVLRRVKDLAVSQPDLWRVSSLLEVLAAERQKFSDLT